MITILNESEFDSDGLRELACKTIKKMLGKGVFNSHSRSQTVICFRTAGTVRKNCHRYIEVILPTWATMVADSLKGESFKERVGKDLLRQFDFRLANKVKSPTLDYALRDVVFKAKVRKLNPVRRPRGTGTRTELAHAKEMVKAWKTKEKRVTTGLKKWERRVRYYAKREAPNAPARASLAR